MKNMKWEEDYLRPKSVIVPLPTCNCFASERKIRVFFSSRDYKRSFARSKSDSLDRQSTPTVSREVTSALSRDICTTASIKISLSSFHLSFSLSTPINFVLAAPDRHAPLRLITFHAEQRAKKRGYRANKSMDKDLLARVC